MTQNYINHIALVLDASSSMGHLQNQLVKVADAQIAYLAQRSRELDQETRVSVYTFNSEVKCVIYDKDVLRLPSIAQHYRPFGWTALIDATMKSQEDLSQTAQLYGDHAFLTYVLTDGAENKSRRWTGGALAQLLEKQAENWTVAVLVPDQIGKFEAKKFGFPVDNIAIWDAKTVKGVVEVGETIRQATDNFMVGRSSGIRGTRSLFSTGGIDTLNKNTVKAARLRPLARDTYDVLKVDKAYPIREWVQEQGHHYLVGKAFYQLTKAETVQPQKTVAIRNRKSGRFHTGPEARNLLGLSQVDNDRVKPDLNPEYDIFIQSTSVNRKLVPGTKLLLLK